MKKYLWFCVFVASQIASAADVFVKEEPRPFNLGDPLEVDATIGGYPIWAGEKKWRLVKVDKHDSKGIDSVSLGEVSLFQTEDKKFVAAMQVSANLSENRFGSDWTDEPCKRDDMLFKESIGGKFTNVNCVTINHVVGFFNNPSKEYAAAYALLKEQGIDIPPTVLLVTFTRYTEGGRRFVTALSINPELAGFTRDQETHWGRSPWHKSQSFNDPKKKQFIDALGVWALKFARQMDDAFKKKSDAFASIPSWRSVFGAQPQVDPIKPKVTLD